MYAIMGYSGTCYAFGGLTVLTGVLVLLLFTDSKKPSDAVIEGHLRETYTAEGSVIYGPSSGSDGA